VELVARIKIMIDASRILARKAESGGQLGQFRHRSENDTVMDLKPVLLEPAHCVRLN
jgi:hypothetical protein